MIDRQVVLDAAGDRAAEDVGEHRREQQRLERDVEQLLGVAAHLLQRTPCHRQGLVEGVAQRWTGDDGAVQDLGRVVVGGQGRGGRGAHRTASRSSGVGLVLGGVTGDGHEHLVEGGLLDGRGRDGQAGLAQRDQHVGGPVRVRQGGVHAAGLRREDRLLAEHPAYDGDRVAGRRGSDHAQLERGAADRGLQLVRGALGDLGAAVDDRDAAGQLVGLVEVLGREQHGAALADQLADRVPHLAAGARVEAGGRLVEEDQRGPGDQAGREVEPAAHAAGELPDLLVGAPRRARSARAGRAAVARDRAEPRPCRRPNSHRFS